MSDALTRLLEKLEADAAKATPGPRAVIRKARPPNPDVAGARYEIEGPDDFYAAVPLMSSPLRSATARKRRGKRAEADASHIANLDPQLVRALVAFVREHTDPDGSEKREAELLDALRALAEDRQP